MQIVHHASFQFIWVHHKQTCTWVHPRVFSGVAVTRSLVLYVCFVDRCLFFCPFFFWPLCCLLFFDIRILINNLVSSNSYWTYFHTFIRKLQKVCIIETSTNTVDGTNYTPCTKHLLNLDVSVWLFAFSCYTIHTSLKNDIYQCIG